MKDARRWAVVAELEYRFLKEDYFSEESLK